MLAQNFKTTDLNILSQSEWKPCPTASERAIWEGLPSIICQTLLTLGETALRYEWKALLATKFLTYLGDGNRNEYDNDFFDRRHNLVSLAMAECIEGSGRFIDHLVDGIWLICEETYWGVPAHLMMQRKGYGLPDVTDPTVDLFAAETGMLLAYIDHLLSSQLESVSPLIRPRIAHEIQRRILIPNFERDDFHWMGFNKTTEWRNNWSPWICSNWLACVLMVECDLQLRQQMVYKIMLALDNYIDSFPSDGGCDEGPNYWGRAAASVFDCLELLHKATSGQINLFKNPLIRSMANFIYRTHIADDYYVNFADGSAIFKPDAVLIYSYGKCIDDLDMQSLGVWLGKSLIDTNSDLGAHWRSLILSPLRGLRALFGIEAISSANGQPPLPRDTFLPVVQIMTARDKAGSTSGFYVAAKGGHNNESHNHNDVGEFIIYYDGKPLLIDVGVERYTHKTFSKQRYEIWTMQSAYHNLPTIDGIMQSNGNEFAARTVTHRADDELAEFRIDIAGAYSPEAGLRSWQRTVRLQRGKHIIIEDAYELDHVPYLITLSLLTACLPSIQPNGYIRLSPMYLNNGRQSASGIMHYDADKLIASVESITTDDERLIYDWGHQLYRILLTAIHPDVKDAWCLKIENA